VLLQIIPQTESQGGIVFPKRTVSPEEQQELDHHPTPPAPIRAKVIAIGPWLKTPTGMLKPPHFPPGSTVYVRPGSGKDLNRGIGERLKIVRQEDILAYEEFPSPS